jgi:hypothetical protein
MGMHLTSATDGLTWASASPDLLIVAEGASAFGAAIGILASDPQSSLGEAVKAAAQAGEPGPFVVVRLIGDAVEYLVGGDTELLIDRRGGVNQIGGRHSSDDAIAGSMPRAYVRRMALLTAGAARIIDLFGLLDADQLLDVLELTGPGDALRRLRAVEQSDPDGLRWPRSPRTRPATIVFARC